MKKVIALSCLALLILLGACGGNTNAGNNYASSPEDLQANLRTEVMAIHDEVMPKMGQMNRIARDLRAHLQERPDIAPEQKQTIETVTADLDNAGEAMMDWMAAYGDLVRSLPEMDHEAAMQALEKEKEKIAGVRDAMLSSLEAGAKLLAEVKGGE